MDTLGLLREPDAYTTRFVSSCLCVGFAHINTASYIRSDATELATAVKLNLIYMQMTVSLRMAEIIKGASCPELSKPTYRDFCYTLKLPYEAKLRKEI